MVNSWTVVYGVFRPTSPEDIIYIDADLESLNKYSWTVPPKPILVFSYNLIRIQVVLAKSISEAKLLYNYYSPLIAFKMIWKTIAFFPFLSQFFLVPNEYYHLPRNVNSLCFVMPTDRMLRSWWSWGLRAAAEAASHRMQGHGNWKRLLLWLCGWNNMVSGGQICMVGRTEPYCRLHSRM